jgi:hypothetical protein
MTPHSPLDDVDSSSLPLFLFCCLVMLTRRVHGFYTAKPSGGILPSGVKMAASVQGRISPVCATGFTQAFDLSQAFVMVVRGFPCLQFLWSCISGLAKPKVMWLTGVVQDYACLYWCLHLSCKLTSSDSLSAAISTLSITGIQAALCVWYHGCVCMLPR